MANRSQMVGYVVLTVVGLFTAAALLSPSFIPPSTLAWMTLGAMGLGVVLSTILSGLRPAPAVAQLLFDRDTPAGPRGA